jgi:hypothetical protein
MNQSVALLTAALLIAAGPALAQDKAKAPQRVQKSLIDNAKVRAYESISKPGEVSSSVARPYRIVRVLEGGTSQRTFDDGKTQTVQYKTGAVFEAGEARGEEEVARRCPRTPPRRGPFAT